MMRHRVWLGVLVLQLVAGVACADSPGLLFNRSELPKLRERIAQREHQPVWTKLLADAEAYCDLNSNRYANPADPFPLPEKQDRVSQSRHDALLVHTVGRRLTQWMEAIGFAYQLTGRSKLGQHGAALLLATVQRYPVTNPTVAKGFAGGRGDVMRGLAIGYDLLSECLDDSQRQMVAAACSDYINEFVKEFNNPKVWWYKVHNYNGVNGGAAGCLALVLRDAYPDRVNAWTDECVKIIQRWLSTGFDQDGAYLEGVTYSRYGLSNTVLFADALARNGDDRIFQHPTFDRLAEYYALSLLPGERVYDARNDSSYAGLDSVLLRLAEARNSGLYRWLWDNSGSDNTLQRILWDNDIVPVSPEAAGVPLAKHFKGRGLCVWRTGWTGQDVMFSIEAGPYYPVTHNQADKGHFTLYGLGQRWATDPGYANEHNENGRGQTVAHSCVLIDGKGQALSGAGWGTDGTITNFANKDRYGYALADCTEAYNRNNRDLPGAVVQYARRHALFVYPKSQAPAYAVIVDDIRKDDQDHEYVWQMMCSDSMETAVSDDGRAIFQPIQASGGAYVDTPIEADVSEGTQRSGTGECVLAFNINEPGEYTLWARVRTLAEQKGSSDSFFVRMDSGERVAWHMTGKDVWTWDKVSSGVDHQPVSYRLDPGQHRLAVQTRERGAQLDCLFLTRDETRVPSVAAARSGPLFLEAETGMINGAMRVVHSPTPESRLVVRIAAAGPMTLTTDIFQPEDYHAPAVFPRFRVACQQVNPCFIAILLPLPADVNEPEVRFEADQNNRRFSVVWPEHTDRFEWAQDQGTVTMSDES